MTLTLNGEQKIRVTSDYKCDNFVDIHSLSQEIGMAIDLYSHFHYLEIRCNELGDYRMFFFMRKSDKNIAANEQGLGHSVGLPFFLILIFKKYNYDSL